MAKILCIETATTNCSVALSENGSVLVLKEDNSKNYSHAERLHQFIEEVCLESGYGLDEIDAFAVSKGPGSYTGLRIGVSTAKGLCYALDKPLISVLTLSSLVQMVRDDSDYIIPMLDARRMEVYAAIYNAEGKVILDTEAIVLDALSFKSYLEKGVVTFIGSGVEKFEVICNHKNARFLDTLPSAAQMAALANEKYHQNKFEDIAYFEPFYLKDFMLNKKA